MITAEVTQRGAVFSRSWEPRPCARCGKPRKRVLVRTARLPVRDKVNVEVTFQKHCRPCQLWYRHRHYAALAKEYFDRYRAAVEQLE